MRGNKSKGKNKEKVIKKKNLKVTLDTPFDFGWPPINYSSYSDIVSCLTESLTKIGCQNENETSELAPSFEERKKFSATKSPLSSAIKQYVTFGFNAVMRALEKNQIRCLIVNVDAKPDFLLKTFIPICKLRSVPLIPVKDLSNVVRKLVGFKSTLALGLSELACEKEAPFYDLYCKCCKALDYDVSPHMKLNEVSNSSSETFESLKILPSLKKKDIKDCHLQRPHKSERVFKPPTRQLQPGTNVLCQNIAFIGIHEGRENGVSPVEPFRNKDKIKGKKSLVDVSECSFFIDTGERSIEPANLVPSEESNVSMKKVAADKKRKKGNNEFCYVSTKIKRTKSNPQRQ